MITATASLFLPEKVEGVFRMAVTEQKSVNILVESAETVARAVYNSDKGGHYKQLVTCKKLNNK